MQFSPSPLGVPATCLDKVTFDEILERVYLPGRRGIGQPTLASMRNQLRRWGALMEDLSADKVDRQTLIQFRDKCVSKGLTAATTNGSLKTIINLMRTAGFEIDHRNLMIGWQAPAQKFTLDELNRLWAIADQAKWPSMAARGCYRALEIDAIPGAWWRAVLMLAYTTGMRRRDLFNLRWDQVERVSILATFGKGARPKRLPITESLRQWLELLSKNNTATVLGRADGNSFDQELARLRELSGIEHLSMQRIRYLSVNEWEKAGKGCGTLILNHKRGIRVSESNYNKLANAASELRYPSELLKASKALACPKLFLDPDTPEKPNRAIEEIFVPTRGVSTSLATFDNFFSSRREASPNPLKCMTLRQVFESSLRPLLETDGAAEATIRSYRLALSHFERLTSNLPINQITTEYLESFRKAAKARTNYSPASCNQWFRGLRTILNHLGPRSNSSRRSRAALAFWSEVPWLDNLPEDEPNPVHIDDNQLNRIYQHCDIAEWPPRARTNCDPSDWWRCALVIMVNYGQRMSDWYYLRSKAICFEFEKEFCTFTAKKTGKKHRLALNDTLIWHLKKLDFGEREFVFNPSKTKIQFYREWHRIQRAAGVADPEGAPFTFHAVRATAAARYHEYFPGTAELLLGHGLRRNSQVTVKHYLGNALLKPLWNAIRNIPQPTAFVEAMQVVPAGH